ncbi:hypothetical protein Tco_0870190 [Tanacetum coccineum]
MVEGTENIENNEVVNFVLNNQNDPDTRLDPGSYKKNPKVEITIVVAQHVNVIEEEDESAEDDYEFRRREKGKNIGELTVTDPIPSSSTPSSSSFKLSSTQRLLSLFKPKTALKIKFEGLHASNTPCRSFVIRPRDQDDPYDDAHPS